MITASIKPAKIQTVIIGFLRMLVYLEGGCRGAPLQEAVRFYFKQVAIVGYCAMSSP